MKMKMWSLKVLNPPSFDFTPKEHFELGESLNWLDFVRGVKNFTKPFLCA